MLMILWWWPIQDVGDRIIMLATFFVILAIFQCIKSVINILNLSSTHFVYKIRHQHRCHRSESFHSSYSFVSIWKNDYCTHQILVAKKCGSAVSVPKLIGPENLAEIRFCEAWFIWPKMWYDEITRDILKSQNVNLRISTCFLNVTGIKDFYYFHLLQNEEIYFSNNLSLWKDIIGVNQFRDTWTVRHSFRSKFPFVDP